MVGRKRKPSIFNFMAKDEIVPSRIISGLISQNNVKFGAIKNTQCTSNSVMAIYASKITKIANWTTTTIDKILNSGNKLHLKSIQHYKGKVPEPPYLCADEVYLNDLKLDVNNITFCCSAVTNDFEMQEYLDENFEEFL